MARCLILLLTLTSLGMFVARRARAADEGNDAGLVRVMTFNIRYNNPGDGPNAWPHRSDMVADLIRANADVAGLQEAQLDQIQDLEKRLPEFAWFGVGRNDGKQGGEFCPIFYRRDRFDVLSKETHWLSETPDVPGSKGWDTAITRLVTIMRFRDRQSRAEFYMLNTHLDHIGKLARENGAKLIKKYLGELDAQLPAVVTGDFNSLPKSQPYQNMITTDQQHPASNLVDSRTIAQQPPVGPDSTWDGFREVAPERRIDFIFVRPGMIVRQHRTLDKRVDGRFPSDHLPVVADVVLTSR